MLESLTSLIVSSAVGGAAGSFITDVSSKGVKWLIEFVTAQSPEMQASAKKNMENFVVRLSQRVARLEQEMPVEKAEIFGNALNHPGSALLIKKAMVADNEEKHVILSELIAQRLTANADDMIALAGGAACAVITSLSSRHIKILSILATVKDIRPLEKPVITNNEQAKKYITQWWQYNLTPLTNDGVVAYATPLDYEHLAAMGCIRISIASTDLYTAISSGIVEPKPTVLASELSDQSWHKLLVDQWQGIGTATTTSIGRLIGIFYRDSKMNTNTNINW